MFIAHSEFNLEALGIGPVAERVYLHLIDTGSARSVDEVARGIDMPPSAVEDALGQLEKQHLVARTPTSVPAYSARPPEPAL